MTSLLARLRDAPGGPQVLLRAFLGVTFTYAGLQKLTNRYFFDAANPGSIEAQLHASITTSPVGALLRLSAHDPVLVGLLIAFGELAVGLGTLFGLFGRVAAAGGMAVSLLLFLSVSFNTTPVAQFSVDSDTQIIAVTPDLSAKVTPSSQLPVVVTTPAGVTLRMAGPSAK